MLASYTYDSRGRRTGLTRGNGMTTSWSYDNVSRLTGLSHTMTGPGENISLTMTYNPAGQIASRSGAHGVYAWTGHYAVTRSYTANGLNRYSAAGAITPTYDGRGNLTSAGATTYAYDSDNMLTGVDGYPNLMSYDPLGRLYEVAFGTTRRNAYDGQSLIAEYNGSNVLQRRFVHGPGVDEPLVWYEGTGTSDRRWFHADERGSIIAVSDGSGASLGIMAYDDFGITQTAGGSPGVVYGRFGYTGQAWVTELGMANYRARIYSPTLGRFLQTDPVGMAGGMNLYGYVGNDPVNFTDPSGLTPTSNDPIVVVGPPRPQNGHTMPSPNFMASIYGLMHRLGLGGQDITVEYRGRRVGAPAGGTGRPGDPSPEQQQRNCRRNQGVMRALQSPQIREQLEAALAGQQATRWEYGLWTAPTSTGAHGFGIGTSRTFGAIEPDSLYPNFLMIIINGAGLPDIFWHTHRNNLGLSTADFDWARETGNTIVAVSPDRIFFCFP